MFLKKMHVSPPLWFLRARCWRKAMNEVWPFWNGSVYYGKKNMHIYIWTSIRAIILWSLKALGQRVLALFSGNSFYSSGHRDLDLWSNDPKINRVLLLNHPMKFEGSGSKGTRVIERKRSVTDRQTKWQGNYVTYRAHVSLTFDPKINRGLLLNKGYHPMKFEGFGSKGTQVIERKRFSLFGSLWPWPLTYWPQNQ